MDRWNEEWLDHKPNFYFRYKRKILESMIEGSCINVGCGSHLIDGAVNTDEGLPHLPYPDKSFDTVICSDVLEHIGPDKKALAELTRIARKKLILTVPAYRCLYGEYDRMVGHYRRYHVEDFAGGGFKTGHLFWFLVPIIYLRKTFNLRHRSLPDWVDNFFYELAKFRFGFGTTILAWKYVDGRSQNA